MTGSWRTRPAIDTLERKLTAAGGIHRGLGRAMFTSTMAGTALFTAHEDHRHAPVNDRHVIPDRGDLDSVQNELDSVRHCWVLPGVWAEHDISQHCVDVLQRIPDG